jgi:hypothetical protein
MPPPESDAGHGLARARASLPLKTLEVLYPHGRSAHGVSSLSTPPPLARHSIRDVQLMVTGRAAGGKAFGVAPASPGKTPISTQYAKLHPNAVGVL